MLKSKSRAGCIGFGHKNHSSIISKTISASRFCRGDHLIAQIDRNALKPIEKNSSEMAELEEELRRTKEQLDATEEERNRALNQVKEIKLVVANEANMRLKDALSPGSADELFAELKAVNEALSNSLKELNEKDNDIEYFKVELGKARQFELKLAERDAYLDGLRAELSNVKASEAQAIGLLTENKERMHELEAEIEKGKLTESSVFNSLASRRKQLEQTKIELESASLREKIEMLEISSGRNSGDLDGSCEDGWNDGPLREAFENLKSELLLVKENLVCAQEGEKDASLKANDLIVEINSLRNELKLATEAEEKSKKAMDELALVLKEVAAEASQATEKLSSTQVELEGAREETEQLKVKLRSTEDKYGKLLDDGKRETEVYTNTVERMRLEAEESHLAWNGKEMGFVSCIKSADEEKAHVVHENARLSESLKAAKEETNKLRDILKQAINEANVAKAAASIARKENSQLKDCLDKRDEDLFLLGQQNEHLRINEAAARENVKELKGLLSTISAKLKTGNETQTVSLRSKVEDPEEYNKIRKGFSFDLHDLKFQHEHKDTDEKVKVNGPEKGALSLKSEPHTPKFGYRKESSVVRDVNGTPDFEDFNHLDGNMSGDSDSDRISKRRRALLQRFSDIIAMSRGFRRNETQSE